jgi:hypothetical protein
VHLQNDVASLAQISELALPTRIELPDAGLDALGEAHALKDPEAPHQQVALGARAGARLEIRPPNLAIGDAPFELPVQGGEPLLGDLPLARPLHFVLPPRSELLGRELLRTLAHAAGNVVAVKAQGTAMAIDPRTTMCACGCSVL